MPRKSKAAKRALRKLLKARNARVKCNQTRKQLATPRSPSMDSLARLSSTSVRASVTGMGHLRSHKTGADGTCKRFSAK